MKACKPAQLAVKNLFFWPVLNLTGQKSRSVAFRGSPPLSKRFPRALSHMASVEKTCCTISNLGAFSNH